MTPVQVTNTYLGFFFLGGFIFGFIGLAAGAMIAIIVTNPEEKGR